MVSAVFVFFIFLQYSVYSYYYSLNGSNNNIDHPLWGTPSNIYRRVPNEHTKLTYSDGFHEINARLPNVRIISNAIGQIPKAQSKYDKYAPLSGISWIVSKTLSQELCKTQSSRTTSTFYPIAVPPCDWYWDINCTNHTMMPFWRTPYKNTTNNIDNITYPTPINGATAFIDLHYIYGKSIEEQNAIRLFSDGLIKTTNGYEYDLSDDLVDAQLDSTAYFTSNNAYNHSIKRFYETSPRNDRSFGGIHSGISGYTTNECPFFAGAATSNTLIGHLWKLNHNRIARELAAETNSSDDEYLFQESRMRQIATAQHIIYTEYLPLFMAYPVINDIEYNSSIDPTVSTWFCGLAHRYSHPATPNRMPFGGYHNKESKAIYGEYINEIISSVSIAESVTYPCIGIDSIKNNNQTDNVYVESMLGGLMLESENLVTPKHNEFLRSFLQRAWYSVRVPSFPEGARGTDGQIDLFATDILRTRDWGMPSYNDARELFSLPRIESWQELTDNEWYLEVLPTLYEDIDDLDAYVGGLLENVEADYPSTRNGSGHIGPLFAAILRDQYWRSAAGDRFFYIHNETLRNYTSGLTLSKIIQLNTNLKNLSTDIFTADSANIYNAQIRETQSMSLLNDVIYFEWNIDLDDITFTFNLFCDTQCDIGWIAIGFGEGEFMKGKDIIKMNFDDNEFNIIDSYCPNDQWIPIPDPDKSNDITYIDAYNNEGVITITFKRPLNTHESDYDYPIHPNNGEECCIIIAYHLGSLDGKHSTDHRTPVIVNWNSGEYETVDMISRVRLTHGLVMIFLFGICYPLSAFIAHYLKHYQWARRFHKLSAKLGLATALSSAFFAISTVLDHGKTIHGVFGIICLVLLCAQASIGYLISFWLDFYKRSWYYNKIKYAHAFFAFCILFISPFTIWEGWEQFGIYHNRYIDAKYGFFIFYLFVLLLMIIGEIYTRLWPKYALKSDKEFVFNKHNYHIFSWSEIGEKVSAGAAWIIIDSLIFDVTEWQYSHPGGRRILVHYFGTDCTPLFNGTECVGDAHGNIKHVHTDYAKKQMLNIIVGEVYCDANKRRDIKCRNGRNTLLFGADGDVRTESPFQSSLSTTAELEQYRDPRKLTVSRLIGKTLVSKKKGKRKIVLFEFVYDVMEHGICFDGDYILLHEVDKNTITRAYTPINPKFVLCNKSVYYNKNKSVQYEQRLFLMIRIYKNGRMSKILNKLKVGHTIRITGPFRREKLLPSLRYTTDDTNQYNIMPTEGWINKWLLKLVNDPTKDEVDLAKHQLKESLRLHSINIDHNKYWRRIVLICGGTGVTPMFNMIQHHLSYDNNGIRCNLIWHNRTLNDVCFEDQLTYFRDCNPQRFWVDLKFDVEHIDEDLRVNNNRLNWARLHTRNWSIFDMIQMVTCFIENGVPLTMDTEMKSRIKLPMIHKDDKVYSSIEMEEDEEKLEEDDMMNNTSYEQDNDDEKYIQLQDVEKVPRKGNQCVNDVIILSGPRPFTENIQKAFYDKKPDLFKHIICLD